MSKFRAGIEPDNYAPADLQEINDRKAYSTEELEILYIDMDGVIADFINVVKCGCGIDPSQWNESNYELVKSYCINNPRIFLNLPLIQGAKEAITVLALYYNIYFASTPMHYVHESFSDKRTWLHNHFGSWADERLILTHRKDLLRGDYLIDDTTRNGVDKFKGCHIHFGTEQYPTWKEVVHRLIKNKHHKVI